MSGQRKPSYHTENEPFPARLRSLMETNNVKQESLAAILGVRRQTISLYMSGQSKADWTQIATIAKHFDVSSDWLLGLTDDPKKEPSAIDVLGLTKGSADTIYAITSTLFPVKEYEKSGEIKYAHEPRDILNTFLSNPKLFHLMLDIKKAVDEYASYLDISEELDGEPEKYDAHIPDRKDYTKWLAVNGATKLVEETIHNYYENTKDGIEVITLTPKPNMKNEEGDANADA